MFNGFSSNCSGLSLNDNMPESLLFLCDSCVSSLIPFLFFFDAISGIDGWDGISVWGDSMSTALRC